MTGEYVVWSVGFGVGLAFATAFWFMQYRALNRLLDKSMGVSDRAIAMLEEITSFDSSPLGHGTPVPEEATLPSGDARVAGL